MNIAKYDRLPFSVEAVQITAENMAEVAKWCKGRVVDQGEKNSYVKVQVYRPITRRQTQGFVGDWLVKTEKGFKVYVDRSFQNTFALADASVTHDGTIRLEVDPVMN